MEKIISHSLEETAQCALHTLEHITENKNQVGATIVGLSGELGTGKTTFVQCLAKRLGITESITSPTFVIQKRYQLTEQPFDHLYHIDAYRLGSDDELRTLGWEEIIKDPKNLIIIEWAERVSDLLPPTAHIISFSHFDENSREIELKS